MNKLTASFISSALPAGRSTRRRGTLARAVVEPPHRRRVAAEHRRPAGPSPPARATPTPVLRRSVRRHVPRRAPARASIPATPSPCRSSVRPRTISAKAAWLASGPDRSPRDRTTSRSRRRHARRRRASAATRRRPRAGRHTLRRAIPHHELAPCRRQVCGHGLPHYAQTDKAETHSAMLIQNSTRRDVFSRSPPPWPLRLRRDTDAGQLEADNPLR